MNLWTPKARRGLLLLDNPRKTRRSYAISPNQIAGLQLWLKSNVGAFQDDAKTTPCTTDGQSFRGWADQSGQGTNCHTNGATTVPTYHTGALNGLPSLHTTASGGRLFLMSNLGMLANVPGASALIVAAVPSASASKFLLMGGTGQVGFRVGFHYGDVTTDSHAFVSKRQDADAVDTRGGSAGAVYVANTYYYLSGIADFAGGTRAFYRNGSLLDSVSGLAAGNSENTNMPAAGLAVGSNNSAVDICEVIIYSAALTVAQRQGVEAYLKNRYAL